MNINFENRLDKKKYLEFLKLFFRRRHDLDVGADGLLVREPLSSHHSGVLGLSGLVVPGGVVAFQSHNPLNLGPQLGSLPLSVLLPKLQKMSTGWFNWLY